MLALISLLLLIRLCSGQRGVAQTPGPVTERVPDPIRKLLQPSGTEALERVTELKTAVFKGEFPDSCNGTSVEIDVEYGSEIRSPAEYDMVQAQIYEIFSPESIVVLEAAEIAEQILLVFSNYSVTYSADIVSSAPGCWGIAYGTSLSGYLLFQNIVKNAIKEFKMNKAVKAFEDLVEDSEGLVDEVFNFVGFIGASGSGADVMETFGTDLVQEGRVKFLGCIIDQISRIVLGEQKKPNIRRCASKKVVPKGDSPVDCRCRNFGDQPLGCDTHGSSEELICYVANPEACNCAVDSVFFPGMKWRYCRQSHKKMMRFLDVYDELNSITPYQEAGFCNKINWKLDPTKTL